MLQSVFFKERLNSYTKILQFLNNYFNDFLVFSIQLDL